MKYPIRITDNVVVELTAKQFIKLHDDLTNFYNKNYDEITSEDND